MDEKLFSPNLVSEAGSDGEWVETVSAAGYTILDEYYGTLGNQSQWATEDRRDILAALREADIPHEIHWPLGSDDDWMIVVQSTDWERAASLLTLDTVGFAAEHRARLSAAAHAGRLD